MMTIEEAFEDIAVHECDEMNEACEAAGMGRPHPAGWWGVSTPNDSVIAYFISKRAAFKYRLDLINELLNGPIKNKDAFYAVLMDDVETFKPLGDILAEILTRKTEVDASKSGAVRQAAEEHDVEVVDVPVSPVNAEEANKAHDKQFVGYHKFRNADGEEYGSFEVFHQAETVSTAEEPYEPGWYWWSCFPGCLPDGDQHGPFPTAEGAYLDAIED